MTNPKNIQTYIDEVLSGTSGAGVAEVQSVQRYLNDLNTQYERGLLFDAKAANRALGFFKFLKHGKGSDFAGKDFILQPWQAFAVWNKYGWKRSDGSRRFRYSYLEVARKNGKTTEAAAEGLYLLAADGEAAAEIYSVATKRDQSRIALTEAKNILRYSKALQGHVQKLANAITNESTGSSFHALSADANTLDGLNPHGVIVDEFHAHKDSSVIDVMRSGMGSRRNPFMNIITTAGFHKNYPCFAFRDVMSKVLQGVVQQDDTFVQIFTPDDGDDYENPKVWRKANPNLGISLKHSFIQDELQAALNNKNLLNSFLTKHMNMWVDAEKVWIPDADYIACNLGTIEPEPGSTCYGGLDLSSNRDITALTLLFELPNGLINVFPVFWIPEMNIAQRVKRDRVNYDVWVKAGLMRTTPGNTTDYNFIRRDINQFFEQFKIKSIAYDRWNSSQLVIDLLDDGLTMSAFGQGFASMSAPTKEFERLMLVRGLNFGGNPILRWMLSNVALRRDPAGNIKPDKDKSIEKIDGIVSTIMALGEMMTFKANKKEDANDIYEKRGVRTL